MTSTNTDLDLSVLTELDFPVSCAMKGHGDEPTCDTGPAVWLIQKTHECDPKILPVCDKFKVTLMDYAGRDEFVVAECRCTMPFDEFAKVIGRV